MSHSSTHSSPFFLSPEPIDSSAFSIFSPPPAMKDVSSYSKYERPSTAMYAKRKLSPSGISKSRSSAGKLSPYLPSAVRASTSNARTTAVLQRQRHQRIAALAQRGILLEEEYSQEITMYLHEMETRTLPSRDSMDQQPEIRWTMRPCLVEFMLEVHFTLRLRPETLYLAINILDRYVSKRIVYIKHYQLVGTAALWLAAKFEDAKERVPSIRDLAALCRETYDESAFLQMEHHVLSTLDWALGHPSAEAWLRIFCTDPMEIEDQRTQHVARFLMEITLFYREFVSYASSTIAMGSLCLARYICGGRRVLTQESPEALEVVDHLDQRLSSRLNDLSELLVKKYSYSFYSKAATLTVQYYLSGGHYVHEEHVMPKLPIIPVTPVRTRKLSTPSSASTSRSDSSDDSSMPPTPCTPALFAAPFSGQHADMDKENVHMPFSPVRSVKHVEEIPDQFLPHDFVTMARPALHDISRPSPMQVVI